MDSKRHGDKVRARYGMQEKPIGCRAAVVSKRGDWSWMKKVLHLTGWKDNLAIIKKHWLGDPPPPRGKTKHAR